jgi:hypothetical protein
MPAACTIKWGIEKVFLRYLAVARSHDAFPIAQRRGHR